MPGVTRKRRLPYKYAASKKRKVMGARSQRKRTYKSRKPRTQMIFKSPSTPWPLRQNLQLRYSTKFELQHSAVEPTKSKLFRANSIFDPDFAVGGTTVNGHGIYANMYGRYRVYSVHIRVQKVPQSGNANTVGRLYVRGVPSSTPLGLAVVTTPQELPNIPKLSFKATGPSTGSPSQLSTIKRSYTMDYIEGKRVGAEDGYTSDINGNPGIQPLIEIGHTLLDDAIDTSALFLLVLTYNVRLYEPTISTSTAVAT